MTRGERDAIIATMRRAERQGPLAQGKPGAWHCCGCGAYGDTAAAPTVPSPDSMRRERPRTTHAHGCPIAAVLNLLGEYVEVAPARKLATAPATADDPRAALWQAITVALDWLQAQDADPVPLGDLVALFALQASWRSWRGVDHLEPVEALLRAAGWTLPAVLDEHRGSGAAGQMMRRLQRVLDAFVRPGVVLYATLAQRNADGRDVYRPAVYPLVPEVTP